MRLEELDYALPRELIAARPPSERPSARLLVVGNGAGFAHHTVRDLIDLLPPSLLVLNDTRVIPARLRGTKPTGGKVEVLLLERLEAADPDRDERWLAMGRASKGLAPGLTLAFGDGALQVEVLTKRPSGWVEVRLRADGIQAALARVGEVPLPPYLERSAEAADTERYQTVFAEHPGSVAAPTAGLHFDATLLEALAARGHRFAKVTLHVGPGTFVPVEAEELDDHPMHSEWYAVGDAAAAAITAAHAEGRPVVAVGTTVVRTLESVAAAHGRVVATEGRTNLFIRPPYTFRVIDGLLTNFHLPKSTLLALVMAAMGIERTRAAYAEAIRERYRFFSYGDAMLLRPGVIERAPWP
ncbi:MAG: tRNA preQ1(34) S-adenosylmethionine ribosyltransferase-isomerase QueA [Polyangiales bacterium]